MKILRDTIKKFVKKAKTNYNYFKMGRRAEFDEQQKAYRDRMMKAAQKAGLYNPHKQKMMDEKIKRGKEI